jgi:hypothetical protein
LKDGAANAKSLCRMSAPIKPNSTKPSQTPNWPKAPKHGGRAPAPGNKRLGEQTRKILGKHYANRYRVR